MAEEQSAVYAAAVRISGGAVGSRSAIWTKLREFWLNLVGSEHAERRQLRAYRELDDHLLSDVDVRRGSFRGPRQNCTRDPRLELYLRSLR